MSKFAKVVIPLIMNDIKLDDFSEKSGFVDIYTYDPDNPGDYRDWETDRKSTRLNSSHSAKSRMPSSA